jgi:transcriptional regulator NrdR family protein
MNHSVADHFKCPECGSSAKVIDTRGYKTFVRRRKECLSRKKHRFTTYEMLNAKSTFQESEDLKMYIRKVLELIQ